MPFQSEAQRRYLWANEPEIAKDWTDTYGSKIQAADGGITGLYGGGSPEDLYLQYLTRRKNQGSEYSPSRSEYESYVNRPIQMGRAMPEGGFDEIRRQRAESGPSIFAVPDKRDNKETGGRMGYLFGKKVGYATADPNRAPPKGNLKDNILNLFSNKFFGKNIATPVSSSPVNQDNSFMGSLVSRAFKGQAQDEDYSEYLESGSSLPYQIWKASRPVAAEGGRVNKASGGLAKILEV